MTFSLLLVAKLKAEASEVELIAELKSQKMVSWKIKCSSTTGIVQIHGRCDCMNIICEGGVKVGRFYFTRWRLFVKMKSFRFSWTTSTGISPGFSSMKRLRQLLLFDQRKLHDPKQCSNPARWIWSVTLTMRLLCFPFLYHFTDCAS